MGRMARWMRGQSGWECSFSTRGPVLGHWPETSAALSELADGD